MESNYKAQMRYYFLKWAPSINCSNKKRRELAQKFRKELHLSEQGYRQFLSWGRSTTNVLERLLSEKCLDEIDFSKLPARAGMLYRKCFARNNMTKERYKEFVEDESTTVNAGTLYPYDLVHRAIEVAMPDAVWWNERDVPVDTTERLALDKMWVNLDEVIPMDSVRPALICADTSGSMCSGINAIKPIEICISLALYMAERLPEPWRNHYISFSRQAKLIELKGEDFVDNVNQMVRANLCENTNLLNCFHLIEDTILHFNVKPEDVPGTLIIISDMEIDAATSSPYTTTMEQARRDWENILGEAYPFPKLVYWNVDARNDTILEDPSDMVSFVSGASPNLFNQVMRGVTGYDLMDEIINSPRYKDIIVSINPTLDLE